MTRKPTLRKRAPDRRAFPRTSVLWSALIATGNGESAFACIIRNIIEGGAEITSRKLLKPGEQVYLLVTRSRLAYLASVAWINAERAGLSFGRTWDVEAGLPPELGFLRECLAAAKLSQMMDLVERGMSLEQAAGNVGWTKDEADQLGGLPSADGSILPALLRTKEPLD